MSEPENCPTCGGSGQVTTNEGHQVGCGTCGGSGTINRQVKARYPPRKRWFFMSKLASCDTI
ncbi:MAG: hypothetical protein UV37_C0010G0011 [Candidatus Collierbacteria bacterium GW2011_GWA1_42_60]|uniref:Chaperone protein DnaJ n=1 Tax=Candidatus Collierbacteria bacterium GW2011_GWA2_42_17 TaxID=1618378 RepID=A0A0G1C0J0_9BACT|nr:MAG: hypothetical protein UU94_C0004G0085 [Candidatus Collierbacteria bacterium GW2011_GWB2_42_12]KKS43148.1 MAG: hypothetical protein UV06_C0002G0050 [Candidatus Collierbacteria bacterium GW2011_GWA2_42_17]KKS62167.1 MAG: hypothetical protein UV28_C0016G0012 [Candidatus Collierbacteria bacterium GW2011_GWE2_42_48]KKS67182.1 MAG: hypothetical protein UV37_C0010G0011 [Candidatus Collierbacteria bacterium GW2011_GWA1_42_60]